MPKGGARPGAGRKPGGTNKKTREIAELAAAEGITPLEVMVLAMRRKYEAGDLDGAASIAKDAAPYMHPRLSSVESKVDARVESFAVGGEPLSDDEWERQYAQNHLVPTAGAAESPH